MEYVIVLHGEWSTVYRHAIIILFYFILLYMRNSKNEIVIVTMMMTNLRVPVHKATLQSFELGEANALSSRILYFIHSFIRSFAPSPIRLFVHSLRLVYCIS